MSNFSTNTTAVAAPDDAVMSRPYVEWSPIFACAVVAAATALTSPYPSSGASGKAVGIAAAIYAVWVGVSAAVAGGYLAGRLRHRTFDSTQHESEIRNGAHGLAVWAVAALLTGTVGLLAAGPGNASWLTSGEAQTPKLVDRAADSLLRTDRIANGTFKPQVVPLLEKAATGRELASDEKAFLSRATASQTGVSAADADKRVDVTVTTLRDDVNAARKAAIVAAFLAAATLAISAAAAWFGAQLGGTHRDEGTRVALLNLR